MPYPNDRRKPQPEGDEVLSREYLAMMAAHGRQVGPTGDATARRQPQEQRYGRRKDDLPLPERDRRRAED